ncbi:acetyltransferase-like isoleucine patch superfamily enzyme [Aeromonas hydrophila]|uniref:acyltransferase n=1 Tax=Aeromonas hydrophila TaxID=644 RepID=UPI0021686B10|nr:acyltransferase [Aeromonas hydrophila]MCS3767089.1 acetyltransferase-like isoleucine patch superfamily enzyme [Aeromonas hydrophila]
MSEMVKKLSRLLSRLKWKVITYCYYSTTFHSFGKNNVFISPMLILGERHISIGNNCVFRNGLRLEVVDPQSDIVIDIGDNVNIEQNVHIIGRGRISIGNNVSLTAGCSIVDVVHPLQQPSSGKSYATVIDNKRYDVSIGDYTMIGIGAHISPGVTIGKGCVIGAHAVVTKDIPDYCVCAGIPARIIKRYNNYDNVWEVVNVKL